MAVQQAGDGRRPGPAPGAYCVDGLGGISEMDSVSSTLFWRAALPFAARSSGRLPAKSAGFAPGSPPPPCSIAKSDGSFRPVWSIIVPAPRSVLNGEAQATAARGAEQLRYLAVGAFKSKGLAFVDQPGSRHQPA